MLVRGWHWCHFSGGVGISKIISSRECGCCCQRSGTVIYWFESNKHLYSSGLFIFGKCHLKTVGGALIIIIIIFFFDVIFPENLVEQMVVIEGS